LKSDLDLGRTAKCLDNKHILLGYIKLFNLLTGKEVWSFDVKGEYILFSPDGKYLITEKELWDINKAEVKHTLPEGSYFAGFSPDSKYAIVIEHQKEEDDDGNDKIKFSFLFLNISNLKIDKRFDDIEPPEDRTSITFSCDKRYIVYKTGGNSLSRLDITNGEYETFEIGTDNESILSVYKDNILLASEYRLRIVNITNGETIITMIPKSIKFGKEKGWVVLTNKGYYDSSSYSIEEEFLRVVEGNKRYNINLYRNKFRKPEIVKSVFANIYSSCNK
jgi:WD40 repeat protein